MRRNQGDEITGHVTARPLEVPVERSGQRVG
jgi:hypothetical protein